MTESRQKQIADKMLEYIEKKNEESPINYLGDNTVAEWICEAVSIEIDELEKKECGCGDLPETLFGSPIVYGEFDNYKNGLDQKPMPTVITSEEDALIHSITKTFGGNSLEYIAVMNIIDSKYKAEKELAARDMGEELETPVREAATYVERHELKPKKFLCNECKKEFTYAKDEFDYIGDNVVCEKCFKEYNKD